MHPIQVRAREIHRRLWAAAPKIAPPILSEPVERFEVAPEPPSDPELILIDPDPIPPAPPSIRAILLAVANFYGLTEIDIRSHRRTKEIAVPRQIVMYIARTITEKSMPFIGARIGGKDHTTVLHGYRKILGRIPGDRELADEITYLIQELEGK